MTYFSLEYLVVFLPLIVLAYMTLPKKARPFLLLLGSYVFFWSISEKLIAYLILSTLSIHHFGIWLGALQVERKAALKSAEKDDKKAIKKQNDTKQNAVVILAIILHIGVLATLKYSGFFITNVNTLLAPLGIALEIPRFMVPIGISFYTMQAVSYIADVRRGVISPDRNLLRLALYMGFFPQIMEGPIARYSETANDLYESRDIDYKNLTFGFQRILYGFVKKILVADRLNQFVKVVFLDYEKYDGGMIALGAILYTCQLYMDFSGAMDLVIGSAQIFGVKLPENFKQPFFSKNISEFWSRWHITLGTWFKDYIFYPVSLSKPLKSVSAFGRKHFGNQVGALLASSVALFAVWLANGVWHGAAWMYIFFGMYHFVLILLGNIFEPHIRKVCEKLKINRNHSVYVGFRIFKTSCLVVIGELFFRANGLRNGLKMFARMFTHLDFTQIFDGTVFKAGIDIYDLYVVLAVVALVFVISVLKERGINVREGISKLALPVRWALWLALIAAIVIFGAFGTGYVPVDPMYANF